MILQICTLVGKKLEHLWMSEEAGHDVEHGDGTDVHDMLFSTVVLVLTEPDWLNL